MEALRGEVININNEYTTYWEYKAAVDNELQKSSESFVRIGYLLKVARDTDILRESGYKNVNEFAQAEYGLDKSQVSRFIRINDEYSEGGYSDRLQEKYRQFGYTKLALMLTLPGVVANEITANFSKTEIQEIKEEVEDEKKISDLEVMMEEQNRQQAEYGIVGKVLYQLGHDEPELHLRLYDVVMKEYGEYGNIFQRGNAVTEVLAPSGEAIYSVRIAGEGRKLLSIKGPDINPVIIDVRSNSKEVISWSDFFEAAEKLYGTTITGKEGWEKLYGETFPVNEEQKNAPVAPVQQKKDRKVTKAKVEKPEKPLKDPDESKSENMSQIGEPETGEAVQNPIEEHAVEQNDGQMSIEDYPEYTPDNEKKIQAEQKKEMRETYMTALKDNLDGVYLLAELRKFVEAEERLEAVRGTIHKIAELETIDRAI